MRALPLTTLLTLLLALSLHVAAQPSDASEAIESDGERTASALRAEIRALERDMFAHFNRLNSNDDFDVTCGYITPTGSKIPVWNCEPAFISAAEGAEFLQMEDSRAPNGQGLGGIGYVPRNRDDIAFIQREKVAQMQDELRALALAHPELAAAIVALHDRRLQLAEIEGAAGE